MASRTAPPTNASHARTLPSFVKNIVFLSLLERNPVCARVPPYGLSSESSTANLGAPMQGEVSARLDGRVMPIIVPRTEGQRHEAWEEFFR